MPAGAVSGTVEGPTREIGETGDGSVGVIEAPATEPGRGRCRARRTSGRPRRPAPERRARSPLAAGRAGPGSGAVAAAGPHCVRRRCPRSGRRRSRPEPVTSPEPVAHRSRRRDRAERSCRADRTERSCLADRDERPGSRPRPADPFERRPRTPIADAAERSPAARPPLAGSSRELGATLTAPRRQDRSAGPGTHAQPKAVGLGPPAIVRLKGSLAHRSLPARRGPDGLGTSVVD